MAYGVILGQTPAPPASNVSYDNSSTSETISSTNVQGALNNVVTKTNSLQSQINTTNSNLTTNVNNLQGQINSLSSQIGSGLKANLVVNKTYTSVDSNDRLDTISFNMTNIVACYVAVNGSYTYSFTKGGSVLTALFFSGANYVNADPSFSYGDLPFCFNVEGMYTFETKSYSFNKTYTMIPTTETNGHIVFIAGNSYDNSTNEVNSLTSMNGIDNASQNFSFYFYLIGNNNDAYITSTISNININLKLYTITI